MSIVKTPLRDLPVNFHQASRGEKNGRSGGDCFDAVNSQSEVRGASVQNRQRSIAFLVALGIGLSWCCLVGDVNAQSAGEGKATQSRQGDQEAQVSDGKRVAMQQMKNAEARLAELNRVIQERERMLVELTRRLEQMEVAMAQRDRQAAMDQEAHERAMTQRREQQERMQREEAERQEQAVIKQRREMEARRDQQRWLEQVEVERRRLDEERHAIEEHRRDFERHRAEAAERDHDEHDRHDDHGHHGDHGDHEDHEHPEGHEAFAIERAEQIEREVEIERMHLELNERSMELQMRRMELLSNPVTHAAMQIDIAMDRLPRPMALSLLRDCEKKVKNELVRKLLRQRLLEHHLEAEEHERAAEMLRAAILSN